MNIYRLLKPLKNFKLFQSLIGGRPGIVRLIKLGTRPVIMEQAMIELVDFNER